VDACWLLPRQTPTRSSTRKQPIAFVIEIRLSQLLIGQLRAPLLHGGDAVIQLLRVRRRQLQHHHRAFREVQLAPQGVPRDRPPAQRQMQIAQPVGDALRPRDGADIVGPAERVMQVQMLRERRERRQLRQEIASVESAVDIGMRHIEAAADVGVVDLL